VQQEGPCLFVIVLLNGKGAPAYWSLGFLEFVVQKPGQGTVKCHGFCCFHSCFEDGLNYMGRGFSGCH
jgi:hypothetical protein